LEKEVDLLGGLRKFDYLENIKLRVRGGYRGKRSNKRNVRRG